MAVWHETYELNNVTPTVVRLYGNDRRRGSVVVLQHSGHGASHDVLLGGPTINIAADSYGHRLAPGESLTLTGWFTTEDVLYALSSAVDGEVHVMIVGA